MTDEKGKTQTAAQNRRDSAAGRPLGTLLIAKALDLTVDEAVELRANVSAARSRGARVMLRDAWTGAKEGLLAGLEKSK